MEIEKEEGEMDKKLGESSGHMNKRDGDRERRGRKMDRKLYEAAIAGDLSLLDERLRERIESLSTAEENPLHIASWFGRTDFVKEVLSLNQSLTGGLNSQGLSPLHLASLKGHVEVAKVLLDSDPDVCFIRDKKGRTPLHIAAEKGQLAVLGFLVRAVPKAGWMMTDGGAPILHVCINHNQFDAVVSLLWALESTLIQEELMKEFINLKDDDGNTILHLLASKGQHQVIETLVEGYKDRLDVKEVNIHGLTAMDISMQHSIDDWLEVRRILVSAGATTAKYKERDGDRERKRRKMDVKLYEAAITGDLSLLDDLLQKRISSLNTTDENPLLIASCLGHEDFVEEVLRLNPSLSRGVNSQGLSSLHLASLKGHEKVANALLNYDPGVCFIRDKKGRTPLHIAAEKGQYKVLRAMVEAKPKAAWMMTDGGDPILHVCINQNQLATLLTLLRNVPQVDGEFVNLRDDDGNTILHLLASKGQHKVIEYLIEDYKDRLDVNAVNIHGLTALDISMQHSIDDWLKVKRILLNAGAKMAKDLYLLSTSVNQLASLVYQKRIKNLQVEKYLEWLSKTRETLMVVAILMATVTFQAGMNPPGGVWQSNDPNNKDIRAGESIMFYIDPRRYISFMIFNSLGFVASLGLIVVLVGRFSVDDKVALWTTMVWITVISILLIYTFSISFLTSKNVGSSWNPISYGWGLILIGVLLLVRFPRPVTWLSKLWIFRLIQDSSEKAWIAIKHLFGHGDRNVESWGNP